MQLAQLKTPSGAVMQGPLLITPQAFGDDRGWFYESWNRRKFDEAVGEAVQFSQDNHSCSIQGVLRGLHYQLAPEPQAKLVRATVGAIYDVAVDIRRNSPTYGAWVAAELSAENKCQLWIPVGEALGNPKLAFVFGTQFGGDPGAIGWCCLLYTSPSPRDMRRSRMPSSA